MTNPNSLQANSMQDRAEHKTHRVVNPPSSSHATAPVHLVVISSRQMHMAAMTGMSTFGATVTTYVCLSAKISRALKNLRSIVATTWPVAWSVILALVWKKFPYMESFSCLPLSETNVQHAFVEPTMMSLWRVSMLHFSRKAGQPTAQPALHIQDAFPRRILGVVAGEN